MKNFVRGLFLIVTTALLYGFMGLIFHLNLKDIWLDFFLNFAFIPMQIFVFTLIVDQSLSLREKKQTLEKLNMVIGAFFSECCIKLLKLFITLDAETADKKSILAIDKNWNDKDYANACKNIKQSQNHIDFQAKNMEVLKTFFAENKMFLLNLISNPALLEHDSFTEMLRLLFHLSDEISERDDLKNLSVDDIMHISEDINKIYLSLICEWLNYMQHLKNDFPNLYSFEIARNPFISKVSN